MNKVARQVMYMKEAGQFPQGNRAQWGLWQTEPCTCVPAGPQQGPKRKQMASSN